MTKIVSSIERVGLMAAAAMWGLGSFAAPAVAQNQQTAQGVSLEEIVVTARRTEEKLSDVPISVSAFNMEMLETLRITDATKLSMYTPGFEFTDYTNGRNGRGSLRYILVRGLYLSGNTLLGSGALVFQDGAPVLSGEVLINDSIERVEVLKGPQNVYFGRSTFAGAINYVTRNPGDEYDGSIAFEAGRFGTYRLDGHFEGPLIEDKLTFALDGQHSSTDGQYVNFVQPSTRLGGRKTNSIAATFYATPSDALSVKLFLNYYKYEDGPGASVVVPSTVSSTCNPGGPLGRVGGVITGALTGNFYPCGKGYIVPPQFITQYILYDQVEANALANPASGYGGALVDCGFLYGLCTRNYTAHGILNYEFSNGINFSEITAWHKRPVGDMANAILQDTTRILNPNFGNPAFPTAPRLFTSDYYIQNITEDYSTEARFTSAQDQSLRWTFGGNYIHAKNTTQLYFYTNIGASPQPVAGYRNPFGLANTLGAFGGLYYEPSDGLVFSAEGRWQQDKIKTVNNVGLEFATTNRSVSPRASVTYDIGDGTNVYASYSKGVRPGGFNGTLRTVPANILAAIAAQIGDAQFAYDEEKMWQAEVGIKGQFFDNTFATNVSVYIGKLTDWQQATTAFLTPPDPTFGGRFDIIANAGAIKLSGLEADAQWAVNEMLTLSGTFAYTKTKVTGSNCFSCFNITGSRSIDGKRLQGTPKTAGSISADLRDGFTSELDWFAHADVAYKGNRWNDLINQFGTGASTLVNASLGIENDTYSLSLYATNIFNDKHMTAGANSSDLITGSANAIRAGLPDRPAYGLRAKYNY